MKPIHKILSELKLAAVKANSIQPMNKVSFAIGYNGRVVMHWESNGYADDHGSDWLAPKYCYPELAGLTYKLW